MKLFIIFRQWAGSFPLLVKFFDGNVGTAFYVSKITFFTKNSFISKFFFSFLDTERFFWPILAKKVTELSKLDSQFQWNLSGESFWQNLKVLIFWIWSEKFRLAVRKKSAGLSNCFLHLHGNLLKKKFLKSFGMLCGPFFGSFPVFERETLGRPLKTAFFVSIKSFWEKNCFGKQMKFFINFRHWAESFQLHREFFDGDARTAFYVSKKTF